MRSATAADAVFFAVFAFCAVLLGDALLTDLARPGTSGSAAERLAAGQQQAAVRANDALDSWTRDGLAAAGVGELARGEGVSAEVRSAN